MRENPKDPRLQALRRFAVSITLLNVVGRLFLGFEVSWASLFVCAGTAYGVELLLEWVDAHSQGRAPRFAGGRQAFVNFLLPAHILGLSISMLLYANDRLLPYAFATAAAIASKAVFRAPVGKGTRHFFNPSNFGISLTLVLFPWMSFAPPYQFSENLGGLLELGMTSLVIGSGTLLNVRLTKKVPLISAWLAGFLLQALVRHMLLGASLLGPLFPLTGVVFWIFTFYMITDPGTSPFAVRPQVAFGLATALVYGLLVAVHVVYAIFFALAIVCGIRGLGLYASAYAPRLLAARARLRVRAAPPAVVGESEP